MCRFVPSPLVEMSRTYPSLGPSKFMMENDLLSYSKLKLFSRVWNAYCTANEIGMSRSRKMLETAVTGSQQKRKPFLNLQKETGRAGGSRLKREEKTCPKRSYCSESLGQRF